MKPTTLTVKQLRKILNSVDARHDDAIVIVRVQTDDDLHVGGLEQVTLDAGCTDKLALVIDGADTEDPS